MLHIGITMGCPVGIGPEIILKYFAGREKFQNYIPVILGDINVLERCARELGIAIKCVAWHPGDPIPADRIPVIAVSCLDADSLQWGRPTPETGQAMADYIKTAVLLIQDGVSGRNGNLPDLQECPARSRLLIPRPYRNAC